MNDGQPYLIISADTHAELPTEQYREYIDPEYREDFEAFLAEKTAAAAQASGFIDEQFAQAWFDEHGDGIAGGWDVARRDRELDGDGVAGEVIFPDADAGLRGGIMIPVLWGDYPPYHDRRYDKVWAACQDLQMPVHTHVGPAPSEQYGPHLGIYTTEVRWWGVRPLWFALWGGVFERFPNLRWGPPSAAPSGPTICCG